MKTGNANYTICDPILSKPTTSIPTLRRMRFQPMLISYKNSSTAPASNAGPPKNRDSHDFPYFPAIIGKVVTVTIFLAALIPAACAADTLLNVSYDPTRELYDEYNKAHASGHTTHLEACQRHKPQE